MASLFECRVQFLDDTDPFNSTNFPEPARPSRYAFRLNTPLVDQLAAVHALLRPPHKLDDCTLQLSHNGTYLDLESSLDEQIDELEGFELNDCGGKGKKHSIILRTQLSVRVHACIAVGFFTIVPGLFLGTQVIGEESVIKGKEQDL